MGIGHILSSRLHSLNCRDNTHSSSCKSRVNPPTQDTPDTIENKNATYDVLEYIPPPFFFPKTDAGHLIPQHLHV